MGKVRIDQRQQAGTSRTTRKWRVPLFVALVCVAGLGWIISSGTQATPRYRGESVDTYLQRLGKWRQPIQYAPAVQAIEEIGPEALPYYIEVAYGPRPWYATRAERIHLANRNAFTKWLNNLVNTSAVGHRRQGAKRAIFHFMYYNEEHSVTNELKTILEQAHGSLAVDVAQLLRAFGGDPTTVVLPWLWDARARSAFRILSDSGSAASNAIPQLVAVYQHDPSQSEVVFATLKAIGDASRPALLEAAMWPDPTVSGTAMRFIRTDPGMLDAAVHLLSRPEAHLRSSAALLIVGWRLSAADRTQSGRRTDTLTEEYELVVQLEDGREDLLVELERMFSELAEFEKVRVATTYCLYAGTNNSFMVFLEERSNDENPTKKVEAIRALRTISESTWRETNGGESGDNSKND